MAWPAILLKLLLKLAVLQTRLQELLLDLLFCPLTLKR
jgi:hypothetical protein